MTRTDERGAATAELAMAVPALVSLTVGLVWLLSVGIDQVRMVDAAREAARAVARGDGLAEARTRAEQVAPPGAGVAITVRDGQAVVIATGKVSAPGGILSFLPSVRLNARAVAATESP